MAHTYIDHHLALLAHLRTILAALGEADIVKVSDDDLSVLGFTQADPLVAARELLARTPARWLASATAAATAGTRLQYTTHMHGAAQGRGDYLISTVRDPATTSTLPDRVAVRLTPEAQERRTAALEERRKTLKKLEQKI